MEVESSGNGFHPTTGKIVIQFEPHWFKKTFKNWRQKTSLVWQFNGVENQTKEYAAFNEAFGQNPQAALLSTSFGLFQIMGFNHLKAGFKTVGDMVDAFKTGEAAQVRGGLSFIKNTPQLHKAILKKDWKTFAYFYNGSNYAVNQYDVKLAKAYARFK
jgi:hypothetical protein